uniref:Uncharacterized protein n=1 Tax=Thermosporothrix sp. COM3 TaxID=2490863 RepID=A0A455SJR1_9CHLR|nr:hypothetical protein KTC_00450 [Thermosporothrix sp. COM3]
MVPVTVCSFASNKEVAGHDQAAVMMGRAKDKLGIGWHATEQPGPDSVIRITL